MDLDSFLILIFIVFLVFTFFFSIYVIDHYEIQYNPCYHYYHEESGLSLVFNTIGECRIAPTGTPGLLTIPLH